MSEKIHAHHRQRKAILYVRQSTVYQVDHNVESRHLQYSVEKRLHELGWREVEIIDEDLGRTASGAIVRSGFQRIVSEVCLGKVGAVAAREVSRLARNNQDWHQLIAMCSVVDTLLIDHETVFDSRNSNDRLLLGLKGSMSAYELDLLRQRALEARQQKAERGELLITLPAGFVKTSDGRLEKDPDVRVQQGVVRVFNKFLELGSARQVVMWYHEHDLKVPVLRTTGRRWKTVWRLPTTSTVTRLLTNPFHAGTYVWGRRKAVTQIQDGAVKRGVRNQAPHEYDVLIPDHHEGYVSRETFDRIQTMLSNNASRWNSNSQGAVRNGEALLAGLLRCRRCGRKLNVAYTGEARRQRYACSPGRVSDGKFGCLGFSGKAVDEAVSDAVLKVVQPGAIEAAAQAVEDEERKQGDVVEALGLELRAARYEAERARRQYDEIEPENRLVAAELETRWNTALEKVATLEKKLREEQSRSTSTSPDLEAMLHLADDFESIWNAPSTDARLKKRIIRTLIEEVLVDVNVEAALIELVVHWKGGAHTELRVHRRRPGQHGRTTSVDTVDAVRMLARVSSDSRIAQLLNRNNRLTGNGNPWTRERVTWLRNRHNIPVCSETSQEEAGWMTLNEAAAYVGVAPRTLRIRAERGEVEVLHPLPYGPWIFKRRALDDPQIRDRFDQIRQRHAPATQSSLALSPEISNT